MNQYIRCCHLGCFVLFCLLFCVSLEAKKPAMGPVQPAFGIGGASYPHAGFTKWQQGSNHDRYQVFEPTDPSVKQAGLVVLLHDWLAYSPEFYSGLIRHYCRRGWVVQFPHYQGTGSLERDYLPNTVRSIKDCLMQLFTRGKIAIDHNRLVIVGHGAGAILAANVAASAEYFGLPSPKLLFIVTPNRRSLPLLDLTGINGDTKMVVISGDAVAPANHQTAREIFYGADRVKVHNKAFVLPLSDYYGQPPLIADELAPLSPERPIYERAVVGRRNEFVKSYNLRVAATGLRIYPIDAYDWFILFRYFDALTATQSDSDGKTDVSFLKSSSQLKSMGYWSDGRKLKHLLVTDRP